MKRIVEVMHAYYPKAEREVLKIASVIHPEHIPNEF